MAEIKSTMEMVLERAARMAAEAPDVVEDDSSMHQGMRLAADYMDGKVEDLAGALNEQAAEKQKDIRKGMMKILLRNVVLPRDEELQVAGERALRGLLSFGATSDASVAIQELAQIIGQYSQHKEQAIQQLDDAVRQQLQQQAMMQGREADPDISPTRHPKYQEELSKLLGDLNGQYNDAMDERKETIASSFDNN